LAPNSLTAAGFAYSMLSFRLIKIAICAVSNASYSPALDDLEKFP